MASPCKPFPWISWWELDWDWLFHLCEVATCWRLSRISLSSSGSRFSGVSASRPALRSHPTNHRRSRSLKLNRVTFENHNISRDPGAHVQAMNFFFLIKPLKIITHFNTFHWICKRFLNVLASRKGTNTRCASKPARHFCFSWCWEMKCIRVSGKGHSLIYGIMPSKSSASGSRNWENEYERTLEGLSQSKKRL